MNKKNNFKKQKSFKQGFSLVEVLVTILVLAFGISAVTLLMTNNIKASQDAKNQIIAAQLAQEGTELVRNLKDNNSTFATDKASGNDYRIDYKTTYANFTNNSSSDKRLYLNSNFYDHTTSAANKTKFLRKAILDIDSDTKAATITVLVSWNNTDIPANCNTASKCVSVVSVLPDLE
jgi:type IV pilus modification protein PilV